jgi:hypothetical protein
LPCAHAAVFRHRGAPPPLTRTRSQSQAKQQPAGGGPALLPFVQGGRLAVEHETPAITPRRAFAPGGRSATATAPPASRPVASAGGFSWRDAVIGAGIGFVLALTGAALVLGTRRPAHS